MSGSSLEAVEVSEPGVYDMPADDYHRDPVPGGSLSSSGARLLLPPGCPALFAYDRAHPKPPRKVFELGHAAHKLVLGVGPELVLVDRDRWDTDKVKAEVAAIRAAGNVPLKHAEYDQVHEMAAVLRAHPIASALLRPGSGRPEQSLFWVDEPTGVTRRARLDWLPNATGRRMVIPDYKTADSADPDKFSKKLHEYGYALQAPWYVDGAIALGLADRDAAFVFVVQEKTPPYLVNVIQPNDFAMRYGRSLNRAALALYAECTKTGIWGGYSDDVVEVGMPAWIERSHLEEYA